MTKQREISGVMNDLRMLQASAGTAAQHLTPDDVAGFHPPIQKKIVGEYLIVYQIHEYHADFSLYEINGYSHPEELPLYGDNYSTSEEGTPKSGYGHIKWDGCSNWNFDKPDCMHHFCGRKRAEAFANLMSAMYDIATAIPKFDKELAS